MKDHYAVVVVGSGYGGGIAASRMARAGQSVCVLERGKEFQPGEYPDTEIEALAEMQVRTTEGTVGSPTGLYEFVVGEGINVFKGCGLGGTSLVNANVSLEAEPRVFEDPRWPAQVRQDLPTLVQQGYGRAREMLKPTPYPDTFPALPKMAALEESAKYLEQKFYRPPINVNFEAKTNHVGVPQNACTMCGDCVTGCNYAAKNTTLMNYLPDAHNFGAEVFTEVSVRFVERREGKWVVHLQPLHEGREEFGAPTMFVTADIVMLGAGTLGSTEILLRSRAQGLALSGCVGKRFSGNGDVLGFSYNGGLPVNGIGFGHRKPGAIPPVGPCISGIIDIRNQPDLDDGMVVEEGSVPGALAATMPATFAAVAKSCGKDTDTNLLDLIEQTKRECESLVGGSYHGAVHNTQTYLVMTHDSGDGVMELQNDRLKMAWPGVGCEKIFDRVNDTLLKATRPLNGDYIVDPLWTKLLHKDLVTVHPLGGCVMADDAANGVVNHKGQVYSDAAGAAVYDSLYVCDGSVIPVPLGVNPLLTISAMAERTCALAAKDRGWNIDYALPSHAPAAQPATMGLQFTETMRGFFSSDFHDDFAAGEVAGKAAGSSLAFTLTIVSEDLNDMLHNPAHQARMFGTVQAPALSARPLSVENGVFNLFVPDPGNVETRNMVYRMTMRSEEGPVYYFHGYKIVRPNSAFDIWHDTSTLYITVYQGADEAAPVYGTGVLHIQPADFAKQMTTMKVTNAPNEEARLGGMVRFGESFAGVLYRTYGGAIAGSVAFDPLAPPRKKRPLRAVAPEVYSFAASDGIGLRLTRYRGGSKGPVILSHGLGVSSLIFSTDTIDTNLTEYLFAHGYDVWLLDFRNSIALPASAGESSGDDVATKDYPAAVATVMELTGAPSVQMVVHCWGSTTFFMGMLSGRVQGVRSAVCSQIATHFVVPTMTKLKTGLHLPSFLDELGVKSLTAYVDSHADWRERLYDDALKLYPLALKEECDNPVCHRISFMYAPLYQHEQLNQLTHDTLHELFGIANIRSFEHIALLARQGHLVDFSGADVYLPHLDRLAIPIAFLHGAQNQCFLPESTQKTYDLLCQANGEKLYNRHVIPGYGHIDCIYGKNAVNDVFPLMLSHLENTADSPAASQAAGR
jgi:cholesterol oxidase